MLSFQPCFAVWRIFPPFTDFSRWESLSSPQALAPGAPNSKQTPAFGSPAVVLFRWQKAGSEDCRGAGELVQGGVSRWAGASQLVDGCWGIAARWISIPVCPQSWPKPRRHDCAITSVGWVFSFFFFYLLHKSHARINAVWVLLQFVGTRFVCFVYPSSACMGPPPQSVSLHFRFSGGPKAAGVPMKLTTICTPWAACECRSPLVKHPKWWQMRICIKNKPTTTSIASQIRAPERGPERKSLHKTLLVEWGPLPPCPIGH